MRMLIVEIVRVGLIVLRAITRIYVIQTRVKAVNFMVTC